MGYARQIGPCGPYELFTDAAVTNWLIAYGFMAGPTAPGGLPGGGVEFADRDGIEWADTEGIDFEDRET